MRCSACWSDFQPWEAVDGKCPYCFPRQIRRVRRLTKEELEALVAAGCPDGHGPWKKFMGVEFCETCGAILPTHVRFQ